MVDTKSTGSNSQSKHVKLTEINYRRNIDSDYTEKNGGAGQELQLQ